METIEIGKKSVLADKRPILFVDGMNNFIRHYMVNQTLNAHGDLYGGAIGFLKAMKYLVRMFNPSKLFVVWEQGGGCPKRKKIYPEYKANRVKQKDFDGLYKSEKDAMMADTETKAKQLKFLTTALGSLPVYQMYIPEVEADDVIAYLVKHKYGPYSDYRETTKIVVSSDKDFYQLLDDDYTKVYNPGSKTIINGEDVLKLFGIAPVNFCLARTMCGDDSDNISGIAGVGLKTVAKRFPAFADPSQPLDIDSLLGMARSLQEGKKKAPACYQDILDGSDIVKRNWRLMYLDAVGLAPNQINKINYRIEESFKPISDKLGFLKAFSEFDIPVTEDMNFIPNDMKILTII